MTDVITKVSIGGQVYPFGGWSSEWQEVVYLTQAEYDALPASKLTDGKIYKIKTSGVAPTPGGGVVIDWDVVLAQVCYAFDTDWIFRTYDWSGVRGFVLKNSINWTVYSKIIPNTWIRWSIVWHVSGTKWIWFCAYQPGTLSTDRVTVYWYNANTWEVFTNVTDRYLDNTTRSAVYEDGTDYFYIQTDYQSTTRWKYNYEWEYLWEVNSSEIQDAINTPDWVYYDWLYYTQDNSDIISKDKNWTVIKTYSWIVNFPGSWWAPWGISNWKIYVYKWGTQLSFHVADI